MLFWSFLALFCVVSFGAGTSVDELSKLQIRYENLGYSTTVGSQFHSRLTLTNTGDSDIDVADEEVNIYVCLIRLIVGSDNENGTKLTSDDGAVTGYHLDGCAHKITFHPPLKVGRDHAFRVNMTQQFWLVAFSDVMPNWYIQLGSGDPKVITNTIEDQTTFVSPFTTRQQYLRYSYDRIPPWTPQKRWDRFQHSRTSVDENTVKNRLVPSTTNPFEQSSDDMIGPYTDISNIDVSYIEDESLERDAHTIEIKSDGKVEIMAASRHSFILAQSTLQQLLERNDGKLPVGTLPDNQPRIGYRGFSLDISRHFYSKETILRHIDMMWRYKLNTFHLHFTDDEAWAVEIDDLPELTEIGSKQCFNMDECITYPQLGRTTDMEKQYLTKQEYIDIVSYADSKGITVIPEVDLPGHATAAIHAMRIRQQKNPDAVDYRLHDPEDTAQYLTVQYFTRSAMNPCLNSSYDFIELIMQTLIRYHDEAGQPLSIFHLGGDEVPNTAWDESPVCQALLREKNQTVSYLKRMMLMRMGEIAASLNVSLGFWEDGLIDRDVVNTPYNKDEVFPDDVDVYAYTWQTVWEWGGGSRPYNMANSGFKVIMCPATRFYMDHTQEPNSRERGYYWARRFTDLIRPFSFRIDNFYSNIDGRDSSGLPMSKDTFCMTTTDCPPLERPENIVGAEITLFSETIFNQDHMDNNVWPRLTAAAERMWTIGDWERLEGEFPEGLSDDFSSYVKALEKYELPYLEKSGVKYHLSPPAFSQVEDKHGTVTMSNFTGEFSTHRVWYKNGDKTMELKQSDTLKGLVDQKKTLYFYTSTSDKSRYSYEIEVHVNLASGFEVLVKPCVAVIGLALSAVITFVYV